MHNGFECARNDELKVLFLPLPDKSRAIECMRTSCTVGPCEEVPREFLDVPRGTDIRPPLEGGSGGGEIVN